MSSHNSLELLLEVKDTSDELDHAIIGSYGFDPEFFELKMLPLLQKMNSENILTLIDYSAYQEQEKIRNAGRNYYLDYCRCGKIFHPKFVLLLWPEGGKLLLGSFNLNENAWLSNGEIVVNIEHNSLKPDINILSAFWDMKEFLTLLINYNYLKSAKHKKKLLEALNTTEWLKQQPIQSTNIRIINNLRIPILYQLYPYIDGQKIMKAQILSPFFDAEASIIQTLIEKGCKTFEIYIQPSKVSGFPKKKIIDMIKNKVDIKLFSIEFKEDPNRYIHAKSIVIKTNKATLCLTGSANATFSGLLQTAQQHGNIELSILRKVKEKDYFDYLINTNIFNITEIKPETIDVTPESGYKENPSKELMLIDAYIEGKILTIEFEPLVNLTNVKLSFNHPEEREIKSMSAKIENGNIIKQRLDQNMVDYCARSTLVNIEIETEKGPMKSDKRWISMQNLELVPRRRDIDLIQDTNGRQGLISILNKLEKTTGSIEWLLYYLQYLDFQSLRESLDFARRRLLQISNDDILNEDDKNFEPIAINVNDIFRKIIKRHQNLFDSFIEKKSIKEKQYKELFDLFIFITKILLWFVIKRKSRIEELSQIMRNIEKLGRVNKRIKQEDSKFYKQIEIELNIHAHLLTIPYIMNNLQVKSGYAYKDINKNVLNEFKKVYFNVFSDFLIYNNDQQNMTQYVDKLQKLKTEYGEFEELELAPQEIMDYANETIKLGMRR